MFIRETEMSALGLVMRSHLASLHFWYQIKDSFIPSEWQSKGFRSLEAHIQNLTLHFGREQRVNESWRCLESVIRQTKWLFYSRKLHVEHVQEDRHDPKLSKELLRNLRVLQHCLDVRFLHVDLWKKNTKCNILFSKSLELKEMFYQKQNAHDVPHTKQNRDNPTLVLGYGRMFHNFPSGHGVNILDILAVVQCSTRLHM